MFIKSQTITEFRLFHNKDFKFGKNITAIAGHNATGKSTILALLGHCGELTKHKPILQPSFRSELSEIIKFSSSHDKVISSIGTLYFEDYKEDDLINSPPELSYRSSWQDNKTRYRIIPKKTPTRKTEKKLSWPTLYLGLSRLYPVGESTEANKIAMQKLDEVNKELFVQEYKKILSLFETPKGVTAISLAETSKKNSIGINTDTYDYLCNSAGQDNLGQILMAAISFRRLKEQMGDNWNGGILLIDELDTTLHPVAQNKLVDFLYKQSKEIGIQIIFTTHSLNLLQYLSEKILYNNSDSCNPYELIYISTANNELAVMQNPEYETIYYDMMAVYTADTFYHNKIPIYSEDDEARYLINKLVSKYKHQYKDIKVNLGHEQLLALLVSDFNNYKRSIFIFDGDVEDSKLSSYSRKLGIQKFTNVIKLPGTKRPEEIIWDYIDNLPSDHSFWVGSFQSGRTKRNLDMHGPMSSDYSGFTKDRDKFKKWFNDNSALIDDVIEYWIVDNPEITNQFEINFVNAFNNVAQLSRLPKIAMAKAEN